jgi:hypothetical protein
LDAVDSVLGNFGLGNSVLGFGLTDSIFAGAGLVVEGFAGVFFCAQPEFKMVTSNKKVVEKVVIASINVIMNGL